MVNKRLLNSKMALFGDTQQDLARAIGVNLATLNAKINNKSMFNADEIITIKERYHLTPDEVDSIFFLALKYRKTTL